MDRHDLRVIYEAFPAQRCPWFFKVNTHDNVEVILGTVRIMLE